MVMGFLGNWLFIETGECWFGVFPYTSLLYFFFGLYRSWRYRVFSTAIKLQ